MSLEKNMTETATGIKENPHGLGSFYDGKGNTLTNDDARVTFAIKNNSVEVPNAGAGSFREVFAILGFQRVEVIDWTSSAGDWSFAIFNGLEWFMVSQENRWPKCGFTYSFDKQRSFCSLDDIMSYIDLMA